MLLVQVLVKQRLVHFWVLSLLTLELSLAILWLVLLLWRRVVLDGSLLLVL